MSELKEKDGYHYNDDYAFFWGSFMSQWAKAEFTVEGVTYSTAEQWMMPKKAELFGDKEMLEKILSTPNPKKQKAFGRQVKNFDVKVWEDKCFDIVVEGNIHKFGQNEDILEKLKDTGDRKIVEASPYDKIWGIGMKYDNPFILDESAWQGTNLLGEALMVVRDHYNK